MGEHDKLYQDQIYGTKVLTPLAVAVIDTAEFQRLAGLKQLGFTNLVYRGAEHTRLAHSIGTYLLTRTIMRRIAQNHERLHFPHPGSQLSECFRVIPPQGYSKEILENTKIPISYQSLWRGLTEVVSIAALLHDIGHVPFGHTLEDEFSGIYERHDSLGGARLYQMLFNSKSELNEVFSGDARKQWIKGIQDDKGIKNSDLVKLIYVILSWKEKIDSPTSFDNLVARKLESLGNRKNEGASQIKKRLEDLLSWYREFKSKKMFHPFMSDIVGNTICADLLDYLPRDRENLGMENRKHSRLQRYLTIRPCTLHGEGDLRISIMVTRKLRGGQRRDVATAVLDIMRERYEMAERVYYHHKKAAASAMLAKLAEICPELKPDDTDGTIYPAPWNSDSVTETKANMLHFSDDSLIDHLGASKTEELDPRYKQELRRKLYLGLRYDRTLLYRTLLVIDTDLVQRSSHPVSFFAEEFRGDEDNPSNVKRIEIENKLAKIAQAENGEVLLYCPSPDMQSKEVDARLEIVEDRVLPLRVQRESFAYYADVKVLEQYYRELWRMYLFVSPEVFKDISKCQAIVDEFSDLYGIDKFVAYNKVRNHDLEYQKVTVSKIIGPLHRLLEQLPYSDIPKSTVSNILQRMGNDKLYLEYIKTGTQHDIERRLNAILNILILESFLSAGGISVSEKTTIRKYVKDLRSEKVYYKFKRKAARPQPLLPATFDEHKADLLEQAKNYAKKKTKRN